MFLYIKTNTPKNVYSVIDSDQFVPMAQSHVMVQKGLTGAYI